MSVELLHATHQRVQTRANGLAPSVHGWLIRYADHVIRRALGSIGKVAKATDYDDHAENALAVLLRRFGLKQASDATASVIELIRRRTSLGTLRVSDMSGLASELTQHAAAIGADIRDVVNERVSAIVADAQQEDYPITQTEISRRVREDIGQSDVFSFERAMRIARTELAVSENTGLHEGYRATGIEEIEWLGFRSPKFARRHDLMIGKRAAVDGGKFTLPSGATCRYPGDPRLPVGEIVHCRCSSAPVIKRPSTTPAQRAEPEPERPTDVVTIGGEEQALSWKLDNAAKNDGRIMVRAPLDALDAAWRNDRSYYLPTEGRGESEVEGRREGFRSFLETGKPIEVPRVTFRPELDRLSFDNGRHRFSVLRDLGLRSMPIAIDPSELQAFIERFGATIE